MCVRAGLGVASNDFSPGTIRVPCKGTYVRVNSVRLDCNSERHKLRPSHETFITLVYLTKEHKGRLNFVSVVFKL